jgi:hypothetical protein
LSTSPLHYADQIGFDRDKNQGLGLRDQGLGKICSA